MGNTEKEKVCQILKEISKFIREENHTKKEIKEKLAEICKEEEYNNEPLAAIPLTKKNYQILDKKKKSKDEEVNQILKNNQQLFKNGLTAYQSKGDGNCFYNSFS